MGKLWCVGYLFFTLIGLTTSTMAYANRFDDVVNDSIEKLNKESIDLDQVSEQIIELISVRFNSKMEIYNAINKASSLCFNLIQAEANIDMIGSDSELDIIDARSKIELELNKKRMIGYEKINSLYSKELDQLNDEIRLELSNASEAYDKILLIVEYGNLSNPIRLFSFIGHNIKHKKQEKIIKESKHNISLLEAKRDLVQGEKDGHLEKINRNYNYELNKIRKQALSASSKISNRIGFIKSRKIKVNICNVYTKERDFDVLKFES